MCNTNYSGYLCVLKKVVVILLLVIYSGSTIGATVNMHYCMNKFADWSLFGEKKDKCAKCGMTNNGCCKDEIKQIKLSLDQQKAEYLQNVKFNLVTILRSPFSFPAKKFISIIKQSEAYLHSPPLILQKDLQAFYSVFLI